MQVFPCILYPFSDTGVFYRKKTMQGKIISVAEFHKVYAGNNRLERLLEIL